MKQFHEPMTTFAIISFVFILIINAEVNGITKRTERGLPEFAVVGKCPDHYENEHCSCDINEASLSVTINCNNIQNSVQLKNALEFKRNNDRFDWFVLQNSTVTALPVQLFNNLSFMGFIMSYNNIEGITDDFFAGSEGSCEYIWMSDNKLKSGFNFKGLRNLKNLISVSVLATNLTTIQDDAFGNLQNLETIVLERNRISSLGENAFGNLPRLRRIDLSWNNLTRLVNGSFNTWQSKRPVAIEKNAFSNLKTYYVNMKYNSLTTLDQEVFEPLLNRMRAIRGSKLFVDGNPFICDKSINWLRKKPLEYRQQVYGLKCIDQDNLMKFASHN
uniref:LRRNT domain-containing protein n=1 Tax=Strigamia maritima TaxID=126957 RepID=T1J5K9_STRMM